MRSETYKYRYLPVKNKMYIDDIGEYISYGICMILDIGEGKAKVFHIPDISMNFDFVYQLSVLFNNMQLDPVHFRNAFEDYII